MGSATSGFNTKVIPRQTGSFVRLPFASREGCWSQPVQTSHIRVDGEVLASIGARVRASRKPSAGACGPPPTPKLGPCMPKPTLAADATEWREHCGTICGVTATGPLSRRPIIVRAADGWPAKQVAAMTASLLMSRLSCVSTAIARMIECMPMTVCSSACRRNRGGREWQPWECFSRASAFTAEE